MQAFLPLLLEFSVSPNAPRTFLYCVSFLFLLPDRQIPYDKFFHLKSLTTLAPDGNDDTQFFFIVRCCFLCCCCASFRCCFLIHCCSSLVSYPSRCCSLSRLTVYTTSGKIQFSSRCLVHFLVFQFAFFSEKKLARILPGILTLIVSQSGFIQSGKNILFLAKNME